MTENDSQLARQLIADITRRSTRPVRLMEFCGGHTVAILKNGLRQLLPEAVQMFSGPGCPVCVTSASDIDRMIALTRQPGVIVCTFGDLLRVPGSGGSRGSRGSRGSLQQSRAEGHAIRVGYSALEALDIARKNPGKTVIMLGIGFETTAPTIAASILQAIEEVVPNYRVYSFHKLTPPAMKAILEAGETHIDGIICPGHVCAITGSLPYEFIPRQYQIGCVVTGFEVNDILLGVDMLVRQIENGRPQVEIAYRRVVRPEGNLEALKLMNRVFEVCDAEWRGFGRLPASGLKIKHDYRELDAASLFDLPPVEAREKSGCICGEILRGLKTPPDCALFSLACTPEHPVGPCMVSSEGACSAYHLYGDQ